jgi:hypothetical protein
MPVGGDGDDHMSILPPIPVTDGQSVLVLLRSRSVFGSRRSLMTQDFRPVTSRQPYGRSTTVAAQQHSDALWAVVYRQDLGHPDERPLMRDRAGDRKHDVPTFL